MEFEADDVARLRAAFGRISRLVDRRVSGDGLTRTQLSVLATVGWHGPLRASELADREGVNPTMLSRVVGKLEQAGLLRRLPDPDDGRVVLVEITGRGTRLQERLRRERTALFAELLGSLTPEQAAQLLAALPALESLAENLAAVPR
ncbi:MAG TPA: MarR family transcriptional regulator [Mycobacteriales bacterium]|nr:MarR family transcriptional regulator [Mycobacteriales bacterium]